MYLSKKYFTYETLNKVRELIKKSLKLCAYFFRKIYSAIINFESVVFTTLIIAYNFQGRIH